MPKKLSDISARARHEQLLSILKTATQSLSVPELVERLAARGIDVTAKTVGRDINELSHDYNISEFGEKPRKFKLTDKKTIATLELNRSELQALAIALNALAASSHDIFKEPLTRLEASLLTNLSNERVKEYERTKQHYAFVNSSGKPTGGVRVDLENILYVLRQRRHFKAYYESPYKKEGKRLRRFAPLRLVMNSGIPYLDAYDLDLKEVRRLRLNRISGVKPLTDSVDEKLMKKLPPIEESFGAFITERARDIKIIGDDVLASFFGEKTIHASQKIVLQGRKVVVTLKAPLSSELIRLLASLSPHICEISPKKLGDDVRNLLSSGLSSLKSSS